MVEVGPAASFSHPHPALPSPHFACGTRRVRWPDRNRPGASGGMSCVAMGSTIQALTKKFQNHNNCVNGELPTIAPAIEDLSKTRHHSEPFRSKDGLQGKKCKVLKFKVDESPPPQPTTSSGVPIATASRGRNNNSEVGNQLGNTGGNSSAHVTYTDAQSVQIPLRKPGANGEHAVDLLSHTRSSNPTLAPSSGVGDTSFFSNSSFFSSTPPTKRLCRSHSNPPDTLSQWLADTRSHLHRPVPLRPHIRAPSHHSHLSPQHLHHQRRAAASSSLSSAHASTVSPTSVSPPSSPVQRPWSSASSGFDSSLSSINSWPLAPAAAVAPSPPLSAGFSVGGEPPRQKPESVRSSSLDGGQTSLLPERAARERAAARVTSAKSLPSVSASTPPSPKRSGRASAGQASGEDEGNLLRCQSQPCVLHERKGGLKRRRGPAGEDDRPSLNFGKMTETAYEPSGVCNLPVPPAWKDSPQYPRTSPMGINSKLTHFVHEQFGYSSALQTIASSPLSSTPPSAQQPAHPSFDQEDLTPVARRCFGPMAEDEEAAGEEARSGALVTPSAAMMDSGCSSNGDLMGGEDEEDEDMEDLGSNTLGRRGPTSEKVGSPRLFLAVGGPHSGAKGEEEGALSGRHVGRQSLDIHSLDGANSPSEDESEEEDEDEKGGALDVPFPLDDLDLEEMEKY